MISGEAIAGAIGAALPFVLEYLPRVKDAFARLSRKEKPLAVLAVCLVVGVGLTAASCYGVAVGGTACPDLTSAESAAAAGVQLGLAVVAAAGASQATFAVFIGSQSED